jgi:sugar phosphate isomerase/epimerase
MNRPEITRRTFLGAAATLAAGCAAGGPAAGTPGGVRFGVRTPFPTRDLGERVALLRRLGYDGIELGREFLDVPVESIQAKIAGSGIAVSAIVGSIQLLAPKPEERRAGIELTRRRLQMARALGAAGVIEVPTFGPCKFPETANQPSPHAHEDRLLAEALAQLAPDAVRAGIPILLEPLTRKETHYMNLQAHGARLIEGAGGAGVRLLSDFYHMQLEEADIARTLTEHGRLTAYVHLADGEARTRPGSLPFDYRPGFRSLKRHGFSGWLTMEFRLAAGENAESALASGLEYVRRQWQEA